MRIDLSERCTGSTRSGGKAHLFGRSDKSFKNKVARRWPRQTPRVNLLRDISRVNHYGLFNFLAIRNRDRPNVRTQYQT